jgi:16S rRNA (cytosine967-C5)-methyltransferase
VAVTRPGGTIVYETCSLEPEEGEEHVAPTLARLPVDLQPVTADELPGLASALRPDGTVRTLPFQLAMDPPRLSGLDGFFVMRLKKR